MQHGQQQAVNRKEADRTELGVASSKQQTSGSGSRSRASRQAFKALSLSLQRRGIWRGLAWTLVVPKQSSRCFTVWVKRGRQIKFSE